MSCAQFLYVHLFMKYGNIDDQDLQIHTSEIYKITFFHAHINILIYICVLTI